MPMLRAEIDYYGLELSKELRDYSQKKLRTHDSTKRIIQGDMRSFNLDMQFDRVFIAFNSFLHLLSDEDAMKSLRCIKDHLKSDGEFILDILLPNPEFLFRDRRDSKIPVMDFKDSKTGDLVEIFERCEYDNGSGICNLRWEYHYKAHPKRSRVFEYQMRMYYPDTINRLLIDAGFTINDLFGDYDGGRFNEQSELQIYICK